MKVIYFGKGARGLVCLQKLMQEKANVQLVVGQRNDHHMQSLEEIALNAKIEFYCPEDPNSSFALSKLDSFDADLFVLAGYGMILGKKCISIPKIYCINLHGGKLPEYRGSSPMNWALINGEKEISISIIKVDSGIDTGNILGESTKRIDVDTTIVDLHEWANQEFPELLNNILTKIKEGKIVSRKQDKTLGCYYPRRFPEDGFILWDQINCQKAHNKIRALTDPYPCAFSYLGKRKIKFLSSKIPDSPFYGEAGRIYRKSKGSFLIGTKDQALWITKAIFEDNQSRAFEELNIYDRLSSVHLLADEYIKTL